jgi:hypothetical protein
VLHDASCSCLTASLTVRYDLMTRTLCCAVCRYVCVITTAIPGLMILLLRIHNPLTQLTATTTLPSPSTSTFSTSSPLREPAALPLRPYHYCYYEFTARHTKNCALLQLLLLLVQSLELCSFSDGDRSAVTVSRVSHSYTRDSSHVP